MNPIERYERLKIDHRQPYLYLIIWVLYLTSVGDWISGVIGLIWFPEYPDIITIYQLATVKLMLSVGIILIYNEVKK